MTLFTFFIIIKKYICIKLISRCLLLFIHVVCSTTRKNWHQNNLKIVYRVGSYSIQTKSEVHSSVCKYNTKKQNFKRELQKGNIEKENFKKENFIAESRRLLENFWRVGLENFISAVREAHACWNTGISFEGFPLNPSITECCNVREVESHIRASL